MSGPIVGRSARWGLIVLGTALTLAISYVAQRLAQAAQGGPSPLDVIAQAHIPLYWRVYLALLHAAIGGAAASLVPSAAAQAVLARAPLVVPPIALILCALALAVP